MAYCAPSDIRAYLGIDSTADDTLLGQFCDRATSAVDSYCDRTFEALGDTTRYFDAVGEHIDGRSLFVDEDLYSVTTITNGDGVVVASNEYTLRPKNNPPFYEVRILWSADKSWTYTTDYEDAITIAGKWAYSLTPPDDVVQAAIRWAAYMYRQKDSQVFDTTAIPEAGVITIPAGIPADVEMLLRPYRRLVHVR